VNTLDVALRLQLVAISPNRSRLAVDGIPAAKLGQGTIAPGARLPVNVTAHADANGTLPVQLGLATANGDPVGRQLSVRVNATRAGLVGWVIAIAAGIVLLGTVVLRIRQVARERSDADAESDHGSDQGAWDQDEPADRSGATTSTAAQPAGVAAGTDQGGAQPPTEQPVGSVEPAAGASAPGGSDDASRDGVPRG
jgi:hypothetical protein